MKKILIVIAVIIGICVAAVAGFDYEAKALEVKTTTKNTSIIDQSTQNNKLNNTNQISNNNNNNQGKIVPKNENNNNTLNNTVAKQENNNTLNGAAQNSSNNIENNNTVTNGVVKIIEPNMNINSSFPMNTVIVENTTGKAISDNMINNIMRSWILTWQFNSQAYCVATGENWAKQWLDAIPNSALINAFIEANGETALSKNITANEINKGAMLYTKESYSKPYPFPFDQKQAQVYIQQMLNKNYPGNIIEKIVFHPDIKGQNTAGLYYVYTNVSIKEHFHQPFWYVYSNTGQATGV